MSGFHLEGAVLGPQVDRVGDASATSLVDLIAASALLGQVKNRTIHAYHFGRLWARDVEFEVGILLPVAKQQREFEEESIVGVAECCQSLGARVPIQSTLKALAGPDQFLPVLEAVGIRFLCMAT